MNQAMFPAAALFDIGAEPNLPPKNFETSRLTEPLYVIIYILSVTDTITRQGGQARRGRGQTWSCPRDLAPLFSRLCGCSDAAGRRVPHSKGRSAGIQEWLRDGKHSRARDAARKKQRSLVGPWRRSEPPLGRPTPPVPFSRCHLLGALH